METPFHIDIAQYPLRVRWFMAVAWVAIVVKCILVAWAVDHWQMPFHAMWIIAPTVAFAVLATGLWLTHQRE